MKILTQTETYYAGSQGGRMRPVLGVNPRRPWTVAPFHVKTLSNFGSKETGLPTPDGEI